MSSQGRWKHTREEIVDQTLSKYVDLHPQLETELRTLLESASALSKCAASKIVSSRLGRLQAVPQTSEKYWIQRGWSGDEAILKARTRKLAGVRKVDKILSPFGREHWLKKINPETGQNYTEEEADTKRNSLRPIRKEFWIAKGHNEEEAAVLAAAAKDRNNKNGGTKNSKYAPRTKGYYLVRGYSEDEARLLLQEAQTTFSLEKLTEKYGAEQACKIWKARQDKWQKTLNNKPFEEQERINQDKIWKSGSMSKISVSLFEQITKPGSRWGKRTETNQGEMMVRIDDKRAMIDFSFGNKLIEFYGDYWHANPKKYNSTDVVIRRRQGLITAAEIWQIDEERHKALEALGYQLLIVWEADYRKNPEKVIEECKNFLNS